MAEFTMPSLGADMEEGVLQEWLVGPGDRVAKGDVVAVVETDKAAIEVECFASGTVGRLLVEPGTRVPVGTPLALIEAEAPMAAPSEPAAARPEPAVAEAGPATAAPHRKRPRRAAPAPAAGTKPGRPAAAGPAREPAPAPLGEPAPAAYEPAGEPAAGPAAPRPAVPSPAPHRPAAPPPPARKPSRGPALPPEAVPAPSETAPLREPEPEETPAGPGPLVRHLAEDRGVDLTSVHGTGRGGRITRADVEHAVPGGRTRVRATPYARRLARDLGVDLVGLHGTGDAGAVRAADVHEAVAARRGPATGRPAQAAPERPHARETVAAPPEERADKRAETMRRAIGDLMSRSKREIPHYYLSTTVDMAAAEEWLRHRNRGRPPSDRLVSAALLLKAAALAAHDVPRLNGFWRDGGFVPGTGVHLGVAVSLRDGGLLAPVIHDADTLPPADLMTTLRDLVQRARLGRLRGSETSGATLTVTSLGDQGVEAVFGVIHPPQVALVGFGTVVERPWATGGLLGVRPVVTATLSADHRATDGAVGARYLTAVDRLLQRPEEL
ncbi:2-oxo acid dehydrogenase subunit E2 [Streptomyces sp. NPDC086766]|uniref:2-oxo acid dehydrogenase subunit E2 n=1 Tax=Streptomyces sp. NPDC086766 TaxID=3365754 RepID=UPI0038119F27